MSTFSLAYYLPKIYYGEQVTLGLEGPFLQDTNDSMHQVTLKLMSGSRSIDVNLKKETKKTHFNYFKLKTCISLIVHTLLQFR